MRTTLFPYTTLFRSGKSANASVADNLMRMNYDIHTGAVLGLTGKIIAFFASLIVASLPITGFYIWWGRKQKDKERKLEKSLQRSPDVIPKIKKTQTKVKLEGVNN